MRGLFRFGKFNLSLMSSFILVFALQAEGVSSCVELMAAFQQNPVRSLSVKLEPTFRYVSLDRARLKAIVSELQKAKTKVEIPAWNYPPYPPAEKSPEFMAYYFLVLNSLNYAFHDLKSGSRYSEGKLNGATLLASKIAQAMDMEISPFYSPEKLAQITIEESRRWIFGAEWNQQDVETRTLILREVGGFVLRLREEMLKKARTMGSLEVFHRANSTPLLDWLKENSGGDAFKMAEALASAIPSFRDPFLKRAQLFVAMLYGRMQKDPSNPVKKETLKKLTVFADYRVPQALIKMGVIQLNPALDLWITEKKMLSPNSDPEIEIRAATIIAGDEFVSEMNATGSWGEINALEVDYLLWLLGRSGDKMPGLFVREMPDYHLAGYSNGATTIDY